MARFAALGYPAQVRAAENFDARALVESLRHVLESPSARLLKAAVLAVRWLANQDALSLLHDVDLSPEATRRLGFLAEKLAREDSLSQQAQRRLRTFAGALHPKVTSQDPPVTFNAVQTDTYLEMLRERADETSQKWQVFADLERGPGLSENQ
ncbi:MAG: hypothetical protein ABEN55_08885 [Bradymonadaceae bacterium]